MTREERRAILGDAVIEHIHREVEKAPPPPPELIAALRRIFSRPAGRPVEADTADAA